MVTITGTEKEIQKILSGVCFDLCIKDDCAENCIQCKKGYIQKYGVDFEIIKPKRWEPEIEEIYYIVDMATHKNNYIYACSTWGNNGIDNYYYNTRNAYKTKEQAKEACRVLNIIEENKMTGDELDEWVADEDREYICCIKYGIVSNMTQIDYTQCILEANTDYFKDVETAQKVISECGKEALKKYYFKVVE